MTNREPDLAYRPLSVGLDWAVRLGATDCLVLGDIDDEVARQLATQFDECRVAAAAQRAMAGALHDGLYAVRRGTTWHGVLVSGGRAAGKTEEADSRSIEDSHLVVASYLWDASWSTAAALAAGAKYEVGAYVRDVGTGRIGRIKSSRRVDPHVSYTVTFDGQDSSLLEDSLVLVSGDPSDPRFWLNELPASAEQLAMTLTWTKLNHPLTDTLYSFASSKTIFRPYQFKPVLKLLASSVGRMLIADEVGLGKTIEAGLIWNELDQREPIRRALVVVPSNLVEKWRSELDRRFDRKLQVLKAQDLHEFATQLSSGADPELTGIISLEGIRTARTVLAELTELHPPFDLVIVDEAHNLRNRATASHAVGRLLSDWADHLLFLSATPINLRSTDLFNLVSLLDEDHFFDPAIFDEQLRPNAILNDVARSLTSSPPTDPSALRRKLDSIADTAFGQSMTHMPIFTQLRSLLTSSPLSASEVSAARRHVAELNTLSSVLTRTRKAEVPDAKALREPVTIEVQWTDEERAFYNSVYQFYTQRGGAGGGLFSAQMPLRQAASCIPAMKERLREQAGLRGDDDFDDVEIDEGITPGADLDLTGISLKALAVDTKFEQLISELRKARASGLTQFMIFSFFRKTLAYLERRLRDEFGTAVMHGGVPMADRQQIMDGFRAGKYEVLLLSEVGSEGLDFEFCNVLVNYDLPWNPMRVEQRIGRIDRFGQKSPKIFIYNMRVPETIEERIFGRLYDRIRIFEESIGDLEPILREEFADITKALLNTRLSTSELDAELERVAVALENKKDDLRTLEDSRGVLSGADNLMIEGLSENGPRGGKFIGSAELRAMIDAVLVRFGGQVKPQRTEGVESLVGTPALGSAMRRAALPKGGSQHPHPKLFAMISDGAPVTITFDPETASKHDADLITARHPLIRFALQSLDADKLDLKRFGCFTVPGLPIGPTWLVRFDLAASGGLRPRLELWTTALDSETGVIERDLGDALFDSLAHGTFGRLDATPRIDLEQSWQLLDDDVIRRQYGEQSSRRLENSALVDTRVQAHQSSFSLKIKRTQDVITELRAGERDQNIVRMHEGRLRSLTQRQNEAADRFESKRALSLRVDPVAIAIVAGR